MSNFEILSLFLSLLALICASLALIETRRAARIQERQHFHFEGAEAAISWRAQILELFDRGLTPVQIRRIMLLEDGGDGYEAANGRIEDILHHLIVIRDEAPKHSPHV